MYYSSTHSGKRNDVIIPESQLSAYIQNLIIESQTLLQAKRYQRALDRTLTSYNQGSRGWLPQIEQVLVFPKDQEQVELAILLSSIMLWTVRGLLSEIQPAQDTFRYAQLEKTARVLLRLPGEVPSDVVLHMRKIVAASTGVDTRILLTALDTLLPDSPTQT